MVTFVMGWRGVAVGAGVDGLGVTVGVSVGDGSGEGVGLGLEAHLAEDAADVAFDCPGLYEQFLCDCRVAQASGHAREDLSLSLG